MGTVPARKFNQSPSLVKELARREPVFITERGTPAFVLLSIEAYESLTGSGSVHESLRMDEEIDFEPSISRDPVRPADL